jgi:2-polyprenyl-3-methyl-5-hydroxy-6-metoxy-1,4-benzoquinol methylase
MSQPKLQEKNSSFVNSLDKIDKTKLSEKITQLELEFFIDKLLGEKEKLKVLEIGCGELCHLNFGNNPHIVGIDISAKQLERNTTLDEKIVANIEEYKLPEMEYDVIVAWWVLEHLCQPNLVLQNCQQALKENGVIILVSPDPNALKGLITKFTFQWFHVFTSRYIFGYLKAGVEEQGPFKTYLKKSMSIQSIKNFAKNNNLSVEYFKMYENYWQEAIRKRYWGVNILWNIAKITLETLSFGYIRVENTDYQFILKKYEY